MPTPNKYTPVAPIDWSQIPLVPVVDPTESIATLPYPMASGGRGPIQMSTRSSSRSSNRYRGPMPVQDEPLPDNRRQTSNRAKGKPFDFSKVAGPDAPGMVPTAVPPIPGTVGSVIPAMPSNPATRPHPIPAMDPTGGTSMPVATAEPDVFMSARPGVPLVQPMDSRTLLARLGVADPAEMRKAMEQRRAERLGVNQDFATGAVLGNLAGLLAGPADSGAYFRNVAPSMTALRSMIEQDASLRSAEDARHAQAVKQWYDTALKGEEMGAAERKQNQEAVTKAEEEAGRRAIPRDVYYYKGADGKIHENVEYSGGRSMRRDHGPFMPDAEDLNAKTNASNTRLTSELAALRDSRAISAAMTESQEKIAQLQRDRTAAAPEVQATIDAEIMAHQERLRQLEGEQNHLQQSMTKFGYDWGKGTPGFFSGVTRKGDLPPAPAPRGGGYNGGKAKGKGV